MKILVIDDEQPTVDMFALFLNAYGYEVFTALDGLKGLEVFERELPDIVLTDIKMPGMDGIEVLTRIKRQAPLTEVIVITGHGDMDLAIKALNLDAADFVDKPVSREALDAALNRAKQRLAMAEAGQDEVSVSRRDGYVLVDIQGHITARSEAHLAQAFASADDSGLVLRFADSASINGAGLTTLSRLLKERQAGGRPVTAVGLSENFRKVFDVVGLSALAPAYATEAEAAAGLAG